MTDDFPIDGLTADELGELLSDQGEDLDEQQAAALKRFVEQAGGVDNALAAIDSLKDAA